MSTTSPSAQPVYLAYPAVSRVGPFGDRATITVGRLSIAAHPTAGHTPGGPSWSWVSCDGSACLNIVYADIQTPVASETFRFTDRRISPSPVAEFERGFAVLERLPCDILLTPHPFASSLWERRAAGETGLIDASACRRYVATARQQLARRLESEAADR